MINKIVRYRVNKDKLKDVIKAVKEFVNEVRKNEPGTIRYDAYQLKDKMSFIHFMSFKDSKDENIHRKTRHVKKFVSILYPNCEEEPEFIDIKEL